MPIIRRRYHYNKLYMKPEIVSGKGLCGQTLSVLSHDGQERNVHFGGFVAMAELKGNRGVMLKGVEAYSESDGMGGCWSEYERNEILLGYERDDSVFVVLVNNMPFSLGVGGLMDSSSKKSTVTNIGSAY